MDALNGSIPTSTEIYALKQATKVQEKMMSQMMESLPKPESTSSTQVSGLASEGIGSNLDIKG